jgi:hypothetical protein
VGRVEVSGTSISDRSGKRNESVEEELGMEIHGQGGGGGEFWSKVLVIKEEFVWMRITPKVEGLLGFLVYSLIFQMCGCQLR